MLKVKIILNRAGLCCDESIGELTIINDGKHKDRPKYGNYEVVRYNSRGDVVSRGQVFDHQRSKGLYPLLMYAVKSVLIEDVKTDGGNG